MILPNRIVQNSSGKYTRETQNPPGNRREECAILLDLLGALAPVRKTKSMSEDLKTGKPLDPSALKVDKDAESGLRGKGKRRRKVSYLTLNKIETVDYKEIALLKRFINDRGKIVPSRQSGNTAKQQRMIAQAIKIAREMALIPFVVTEQGPERREERRPRGEYRDRNENREQAPAAE